jgi:holliday junction DNA helicase RuvB
MSIFKRIIEVVAKILDRLDDLSVLPISDYTDSNYVCTSCDLANANEKINNPTAEDIGPFAINNRDSIFDGIVGYEEIKREFAKALKASSPVGILLIGPPGTCKSEFLRKIEEAAPDSSEFIDGSYGSKAGIFARLYENRPSIVLMDGLDKLSGQDQLALLNLMESGRLTKTTRSESYEIKLTAWVFATANNKKEILEPLFDRFETYFLTEYTDDEFRKIATRRLGQEGIEDEGLAAYIANSVLRSLNRKSLRDAIRIGRKCKTFDEVEETVQTMKRFSDLK